VGCRVHSQASAYVQTERAFPQSRISVWAAAALIFVPSQLVAFACSVILSSFTVSPGPWNHLALNLTIIFSLGILGAIITRGTAKVVGTLIQGRGAVV
jgi:hypothetical protein